MGAIVNSLISAICGSAASVFGKFAFDEIYNAVVVNSLCAWFGLLTDASECVKVSSIDICRA
jgi:hypothetical protein